MIVSVRTSSLRQFKKAMNSRAWLNGVEVTKDCYYADDTRGVVRVFLTDSEGKHYYDKARGEAAKAELHGRVRIQRNAA